LFTLFANGVVDTAGKLPPVSLTPVVNLPSLSTTLAKLMAKFAAGVVNTGGKPLVSLTPVANLPPVSLIPVVHLDLRNLCECSKKFEMVLMGYSSLGLGGTDS
jgi:hypothetical protein